MIKIFSLGLFLETRVTFFSLIRISVPQLHIYFSNRSIQSFQSAIVSNSCFLYRNTFLSLGSFMCTEPTTFAHRQRQLITVIPKTDDSSSVFFTFRTRQTWFTLLYNLIHTMHPIIRLNIGSFNVLSFNVLS